MNKDHYLGHPSQMYGVEQYRLVGGKGDGMRLFQVRNRSGIDFTVAADRCADIYRLRCHGINIGFFSPVGYVGPQYYDEREKGFLKSFTAGFLSTCGLGSVGIPNKDGEELLPMHGRIGNSPAEYVHYRIEDDAIMIEAEVNQSEFFGHKLMLKRRIICCLDTNHLRIEDCVYNTGSQIEPLMLLYHINVGYPLLSEKSELWIPSSRVEGRDEYAKNNLVGWNRIESPTPECREKCYYHYFREEDEKDVSKGRAGIFNSEIDLGLHLSFDTDEFAYFTQWNMFGIHEYAMGLEPSNCLQEGREAMRRTGRLVQLKPGEKKDYHVNIDLFQGREEWEALKQNR